MPNPKIFPNGLVLTKVDEHTIAWEYPPSGRNAKGIIRRNPRQPDAWTPSNVASILPGRELVAVLGRPLEHVIGIIHTEIDAAQNGWPPDYATQAQNWADQEAEARDAQSPKQRLEDYMTYLFN